LTTGNGQPAPISDARLLEMMGLGGPGLAGLDDVPSATHWPTIPADKAAGAWKELRHWVRQLQARFSHLDHHVIPACWWRHNEHVEALAALRDHERVSYAVTAPATAPVEWMRALRDIEALLRAWTAEYACGSAHQEARTILRQPDESGWAAHLERDLARRRKAERDS
jgi:hypothetical protein